MANGDFDLNESGNTQAVPGFANTFTASADDKLKIVIDNDELGGVVMQSVSLTVDNAETVSIQYFYTDKSTDLQKVTSVPPGGSGFVIVQLFNDKPVDKILVAIEGPDVSNSPSTVTVNDVVGCAHAVSPTPPPPTPPEEACRDLLEMGSFLVSEDTVDAVAQNRASKPTVDGFTIHYEANSGTALTVSVFMPADGTLQTLLVSGDFTQATVETQATADSLYGSVTPQEGDSSLSPEESATFVDAPFVGGSDILIRLTIENGRAGTIKIEKMVVCTLPRTELCLISSSSVEAALGFKPAGGIFGKTVDGEVILVDSDTYISSKVTVEGYCYVCECHGKDMIRCTERSCGECPPFNNWSACNASCGQDGLQTRSINAVGFPDSCPSEPEERPCTGLCITTPPVCMSSWSEWSTCDSCTQKRTRKCDSTNPACEGQCKSTVDVRTCPECITTTPVTTRTTTIECGDNQEYRCLSAAERCNQTCLAYRTAADACLEDEEPCVPACYCQQGYYMNSLGACVPNQQCDCYPPSQNQSVPIGYYADEGNCEECMCLETGYTCKRKGCCKGEWTPWSECSVLCGNGTQTRSRFNSGECAKNTETETIACGDPCPCEGTEVWYEECDKCRCQDGFPVCQRFCDVIDSSNCDLTTNVIADDPEQPCCKRCVPIKFPCRPVVEETVRLNYTDSVSRRLCVSTPLSVTKCQGSCSDSFYATRYSRVHDRFFLTMDSSSCECCRPTIEEKDVEFTCGAGDVRKTVKVMQVTGCSCERCAMESP